MRQFISANLIMVLLLCGGHFASTKLADRQALNAAHGLALVGAKIYPSPTDDAIIDGVVLISDAEIIAVGQREKIRIPPDFETLDCTGLTLTAGFWNCHVHFAENKWQNAATIPAAELTQQLRDMLTRYGFTSVFDTGSVFENTKRIRERIESGEILGPRILSTGEIFFPKGAPPPAMLIVVFGMMPGAVSELDDAPDQAARLVDQKLAAGVDAIKIYAATWGYHLDNAGRPVNQPVTMSAEVVRAVASETHKHGKLLLAHPSNSEGLNAAVDGGADIILHTAPASGKWDGAFVAKMKQKGISLVPTLKLWRYEGRHARSSQVAPTVEMAVSELRAYSQAGGTILFGTDVGYMDDYDPTDEFILMSHAGLTFRQIHASLTTAPAERFGASARVGKIAPGMDADITLLSDDPATDVRAFSRVRFSIRRGKIIYRESVH